MATLRTVVVLVGISVLLLAFCLDHGLASKTTPKTGFLFSDKNRYHFTGKSIEKPPKCEPVHINMVIRHGSRYPGSYRVGKMKALLEKINRFFPSNSTFRYKGLSLPWHIPSDILNSASKEMSALGLEEMYSIAKRFRANFRGVLKHGYSNTNYSFVATDKLRSSQSATAFAQGLFEGEGDLGPAKFRPVAVKFSGSYDDDTVLRIFEACPKWQRLTAKKNSRSEYRKFMNGPEIRKVVRNISNRLQLAKKLTLRPDMALEMFLMCAFGVQTDSADSSWCAVFNEADFKVLEYLSDLKLYWDRSYGRKINYKMACPLFAEITDSFERFFKQGKPHGIFRFAHTGTVIPLLTMLGLYNDSVPPRADNFDQQANRTFRVSDVVPMSGNVAFVLYKCKRDSAKNESNGVNEEKSDCSDKCQETGSTDGNPIGGTLHASEMKVQLLVNEAAVPMPACGGKMYCSVQRFLSFYKHIKTNCDIKTICGTHRKCKKANKRPQD